LILEVAPLKVRAGQGAEFERAFREAERIIARMPGYASHELQRCLERADEYVLLVRWRSLADHEVGFRGSPEYQEWKRLLHHFYDPFPTVSHYESVATPAPALGRAHLRVARPSDDLDAVVRFYRDGLGFAELYRFTDHDGFDGVMLGAPNAPYHLEFTRKAGHRAGRAPTEDNLLVFYLPDADAFAAAVARLVADGHAPVPSFNPYWDEDGKTFEDPDGYRVVLQHAAWPE
jgi:heme-degrading monooxygenase HmoA/catechol 2,3-dioxygenase-like lactoylglutathione lyase family enzyme